MARQTKRFWRWKMAERLAQRRRLAEGRAPEATYEEIEEANGLVWRLCRLANDNARNSERDNDPAWQGSPRIRARLERDEERWAEREREVNGLFAAYGCSIDWPGVYPSVNAAEGGTIDIWEMY